MGFVISIVRTCALHLGHALLQISASTQLRDNVDVLQRGFMSRWTQPALENSHDSCGLPIGKYLKVVAEQGIVAYIAAIILMLASFMLLHEVEERQREPKS